jgi:RNA polymerase sigma-70 factor, ECF subfamily
MNGPIEEVTEVIESARAGDPEALSVLMRASRAALRAQAEQQLPQDLSTRLDTSDVLQEVLLEASRDFEAFRGKTSAEWWTWLSRALANNVVECFRRHVDAAKRSVRKECSFEQGPLGNAGSLPANDSSPSHQAMRADVAELLRVYQSRLSPERQRILKLRYWEGHSLSQIAEVLNFSKSSAARLLREALHDLRRQFVEDEPETDAST